MHPDYEIIFKFFVYFLAKNFDENIPAKYFIAKQIDLGSYKVIKYFGRVK